MNPNLTHSKNHLTGQLSFNCQVVVHRVRVGEVFGNDAHVEAEWLENPEVNVRCTSSGRSIRERIRQRETGRDVLERIRKRSREIASGT